MKALFVMAVLAAVVLAATVSKSYGEDRTRFPEYLGRTCSGLEADPAARFYYFGFHYADGSCVARAFQANSYDEALGCAQKSCLNCSVEDITGWYSYGSSILGVENIGNYCPAVLRR